MRVAYFGTLEDERSPRVRILRDGLRACGVEVVLCRARGRAVARYAKLASQFLRDVGRVDAIVVAKPGQREVPLAASLGRARGIPVVHDFFASLWINQIHERRRTSQETLLARKFRWLDRTALQLADVSLVDTWEHGALIADRLGADASKLRRVVVGAEPQFRPQPRTGHGRTFEVMFCGTFIPFHGIGVVLEAARRLRKHPMRFTLIGEGPESGRARAFVSEHALENVRFVGVQPYDALPDWTARSDLCLGLFGDSPTARAVVPKKAYAAIASGRPLLTASSPAVREVLGDDVAYTCRANDAAALAEAILTVVDDPAQARERVARGLALHRERFTPEAVGRSLREVLEEVCGRTPESVEPVEPDEAFV